MRAPEFWSRGDGLSAALASALAPLGWLYGASVALKRDRARAYRPRAKVICVGNLTAGGSGKTPAAIAVGRALLAKGLHPMFLTRGFGGRLAGPITVDPQVHSARDVGDEALLLARQAPTIVAHDRKAGAERADVDGADVIVMDDGHQNFALAKDLSLVVVDAQSGFGNGHVLPAGPLREPVAQGLKRADAVVPVGHGTPALAGFKGPVLRAELAPATPFLAGARVVAFAGIGRPEKFFATLKAHGATLVSCHAFADHHVYTTREIAELRAHAANADAVLMTTEKDFVRLDAAERVSIRVLPVALQFVNPEALDVLLENVLARTAACP